MPANARDRVGDRRDWGNGIRNNWGNNRQDFLNNFHNDFNNPGWRNDYPGINHGFWNCNRNYAYGWWTWASVAGLTGWWAGSGWSEPLYYDYGTGGNVYYEGDTVYVNGQDAGTSAAYAAQAEQLADSGATQLAQPAKENEAEQWLPLGVFAMSSSKDQTSPTFVMQLAVNKQGLLSGTMFNTVTKKSKPIQGAVDSKTQRACWYAGDNKDTVAETGIYNLTKDETSVLVHFGSGRTEEYMLVRLPQEEVKQ